VDAPDPYEKHRGEALADGDLHVTDIGNRSLRQTRLAALSASPHPLDRLSAHRARHKSDLDTSSERRRDRMTGKVIEWISTAPPPWEGPDDV
jgi:hypothetical protein